MPSEEGTYTLSGTFPGESSLGATNDTLTFEVSSQPWVATKAMAVINGYEDAEFYGAVDSVDVGGRIFLTDPAECLTETQPISLILTKKEDAAGNLINETVYENHNAQNCQPYKAGLRGAGTYLLKAQYRDDGTGSSMYQSSDEAIAKLVVRDIEERVATKTVVTVDTKPQGSANIRKTAGSVAGVRLERNGNRYIITDDPKTQDEVYIRPCTTVVESPDDTGIISFVRLIIRRIEFDGSSTELMNSLRENCTSASLPVDDLSQASHVEITASYEAELETAYASSTSSVEVDVDEEKVEVNPWVTLSISPENPTSIDTVVIHASTNKTTDNPVFRITRDGNVSEIPSEANDEACRENQDGICFYRFTIYNPIGNYEASFCVEGLCESLSFTVSNFEEVVQEGPGEREQGKREITGVGLRVEGFDQEIFLPLDGSYIDFTLGGLPDEVKTHAFSVIIHYSTGEIEEKGNIFIQYEPIVEEPTVTPEEAVPTESQEEEISDSDEPVPTETPAVLCEDGEPFYDEQNEETYCTQFVVDDPSACTYVPVPVDFSLCE